MVKRIKGRNLLGSLLVITAMLMLLGCSKNVKMGLVNGYYSMVVKNGEQAIEKNQVTIRINDLESNPPSRKEPIIVLIKIFPLISLIPIHAVETNKIRRVTELRYDEVEEILLKELQKSGIVEDVTYKGEPKDYDIRGKINFIFKENTHFSGLGFLLYYGILQMLTLPWSSAQFICEAHFDVVSADGTRVLLSKDYYARSKWQYHILYDNDRLLSSHGQEVLPQIVTQFISDLKALPQSVWSKQNRFNSN